MLPSQVLQTYNKQINLQKFNTGKMTRELSHLQINQSLLNKYSENFSFFESKIINYIIYNIPNSPFNIQYIEASLLADQHEVMRRYYRHFTRSGKQELRDRLRSLTFFYNKSQNIAHQFPLMMTTSFESIYKRRKRKMRKMIASDGSSDYTQSNNQKKCANTFSSLFLNQSEKHNSTQNIDLIGYFFDEQAHCIYNQITEDQNQGSLIDSIEQQYFQMNLKKITEESLSHLLCDFEQIDEEVVEKQYKILQNKKDKKIKSPDDMENCKNINPPCQNSQSPNLHMFERILNKGLPEQILNGQLNQQNKLKKELYKQNYQVKNDIYWPLRLSIHIHTQNKAENPPAKSDQHPSEQFLLGNKLRENCANLKKSLVRRKQKKQKIRDKAIALLDRAKTGEYYDNLVLTKEMTKDQGSSTTEVLNKKTSDDYAIKIS